jgi:hypothetical protein
MGGLIDPDRAHRLIGPLVGIYDLRLADAHLPSSDLAEAFELARVDQGSSPLTQGLQLLTAAVRTLVTLAHVLESAPRKSEPVET